MNIVQGRGDSPGGYGLHLSDSLRAVECAGGLGRPVCVHWVFPGMDGEIINYTWSKCTVLCNGLVGLWFLGMHWGFLVCTEEYDGCVLYLVVCMGV